MKLTKLQFCTAVETFEKMLEEEDKIAEALGGVDPEWKPMEWINNYYEFLSDVCDLEENPTYGTDLDWFCFETDFGHLKDYCKVYDHETGRTWTIESADILYDFITRDE
jgi:hypothetical protein